MIQGSKEGYEKEKVGEKNTPVMSHKKFRIIHDKQQLFFEGVRVWVELVWEGIGTSYIISIHEKIWSIFATNTSTPKTKKR